MDSREILDLLHKPHVSSQMVGALARTIVTAEERLDALLSPEILRRVTQTLWQWIRPYANGSVVERKSEAETGG